MNFNSLLKRFPKKLLLVTVGICAVFMIPANAASHQDDSPALSKPELKFKADGTFKIVMFSDFQDSLPINQKSISAMNRILDKEKPDFVILGGDQVTRGINNREDFTKYVDQMVKPMESRKIPWAHVFGNHDEEIGIPAAEQEMIYEAHPYCLTQKGEAGVDGVGNYVLPVKSSVSNEPVINIWGLDSHRYIYNGEWYKRNPTVNVNLSKNLQGASLYDFIKFSQIQWYYNTSLAMEKQYGRKIPGLMFFHIPLPEFRMISMNPEQTGMTGEKNEEQCNSPINSGLFSTVLQRGDIKGIFCGHDHTNTYIGTYAGIKLGYDGSIGYAPYGLKGKNKDRLRGSRVFLINEKDPDNFQTWIRLASE